jgi:hypothetical protein
MVCCASVTTAGTAAKAWEAQRVEIAARQESLRIDFDDDAAKAVFKDCI